MEELEKYFMPYKQALELKELGFNEPCFGRWWFRADMHKLNEEELEIIRSNYFELPEHYTLAPTFSQAFRWFREKYELEGVTQRAEDFMWYKWIIHRYNENGKKYVADWYEYKTYKEAELECLKKLIEFVKESI
jgi:hypothetical protein